jgi:hypothetical protein
VKQGRLKKVYTRQAAGPAFSGALKKAVFSGPAQEMPCKKTGPENRFQIICQ